MLAGGFDAGPGEKWDSHIGHFGAAIAGRGVADAIFPDAGSTGADPAGDRPGASVSAIAQQIAESHRALGNAEEWGIIETPRSGADSANFAANGEAAPRRWTAGLRISEPIDWASPGGSVSRNEVGRILAVSSDAQQRALH